MAGEPLENRRWEVVARGAAQGLSNGKIAQQLGTTAGSVQVLLSANAEVIARRRELEQEAAAMAEVTRADWVRWVRELCELDPLELMQFERVGPDGSPVPAWALPDEEDEDSPFGGLVNEDGTITITVPTRDLSTVPQAVRRCIKSWKQGAHGMEIVLHDRLKALDMLGKFLGVYERDNAQKAGAGVRPYAAMNDAELIAQAEERARARGELRDVQAKVTDSE